MTAESFQLRLGGAGDARLEMVGRRRRVRFDVPVYDGDGEVVGSRVVTVHSGGGLSPGALRMTERSRASMFQAINAMPWERLSRPVLITLLAPGRTWWRYVPNDREWGKHRDLLFKRWEYQWGEPVVCFWVKEFQVRGAPHLHVVASLPAAVSEEDYKGLQARTKWLFGENQALG